MFVLCDVHADKLDFHCHSLFLINVCHQIISLTDGVRCLAFTVFNTFLSTNRSLSGDRQF